MHDEARGEKESQSEREMERQWLICETMLEIGSWHTTIYTVHVYILIKNNSDAAHSLNRCMESTRLHAYKQQKCFSMSGSWECLNQGSMRLPRHRSLTDGLILGTW